MRLTRLIRFLLLAPFRLLDAAFRLLFRILGFLFKSLLLLLLSALLIVAAIGLIVFVTSLVYPLINEDSSSPCEALAKRALYLQYGPELSSAIDYGSIRAVTDWLRSSMKKEVSDAVPPDISCSVLYMWSIVDKKDFVETMKGEPLLHRR